MESKKVKILKNKEDIGAETLQAIIDFELMNTYLMKSKNKKRDNR